MTLRYKYTAQSLDAAYFYRRGSVICRSVYLSVTIVSLAETAEPFKIPFGMWTRVGPWNHVLHGMHIGATWRIRLNHSCAAVMGVTVYALSAF